MTPTPEHTSKKPPRRSAAGVVDARKRSRDRARMAERVWWGTLSVLAALVLLSVLLTAAASRQETCVACHQTEAKGVAATGHSNVSCDDCHAGTTGFGLVSSRVQVVNMAVAQVVPGVGTGLSPDIDNKRCLLCHQKDMNKTVTVDGIRMNHRTPTQKGWKCQTCHPDAGHPVKGDKAAAYTMDMCMTCHSINARDIKSCQMCHDKNAKPTENGRSGSSPWKVTHGPNWQKTHGMGDLATCKNCHGGTFCVQCHNTNVPHPDGYLAQHGRDVKARVNGQTDCLKCHKNNSCDNCHGLQMPHPKGFLQGHSQEVKKSGQAVCERCHDPKSCQDCHNNHIHPGLTQDTIRALRENPWTGAKQ